MMARLSKLAGVSLSLAALQAIAQPASPATVVTFEYDASGNATRRIAAPGTLNLVTRTEYDSLQRTRRVIDARGGNTDLGYAGATPHLSQVTDPRSLATQYGRTGLGDLTSLASPDTGTATHALDAAGNVTARTDSRGVVASHAYDALNRLTAITYSLGQEQASYLWRYDETGPGFANGVGRLTSAVHPRGWSAFAYDSEGRVTVQTQLVSDTQGTSSLTTSVRYAYDAAGNLVQLIYPSGRVLTITYNGGRPSAISIADNANSPSQPIVSQITFDPRGAVTSWQWHQAAGLQAHTRQYDLGGRAVRYRVGPWIRDLSYDAAGRIIGYAHVDAATGQATSSLNQSFGYDELGRLTSATAGGANYGYSYDANGNRTAFTLNGNTSGYTVSPTSNRLLATPSTNYSYDPAGNTTAANATILVSPPPNRTAQYDLAGRLVSLQGPYFRGEYVVDGFERRVLKTTLSSLAGGYYGGTPPPPKVTAFAYDEAGRLLGEYDAGSGTSVREYVWLGSTPIAVLTPATGGTEVLHVHADHLDTPRVIVDRSNRVRWTWMVEPFGTGTPNENPSGVGALEVNLRFPGQYFDVESGWHYNWHRDFEPGTGRYVQSDPIGLAGGTNTYGYVGGSPLSRVDEDGRLAVAPLLLFFYGGGTLGSSGAVVAATGVTAIGLGVATGVLTPPSGPSAGGNGPDSCRKCLPATPANIRSVLANSTMLNLQPAISASVVQSYVTYIEGGGTIEPIKVDGNVIVDGNHRYVASLLCGKQAPTTPGTAPLTRPRTMMRDLRIDP